MSYVNCTYFVLSHTLCPTHQEFESLRRCVLSSLGQLQEEHVKMSTRVSAGLAGALVSLNGLPGKLNPVIRPLMDSIKTEQDPVLRVSIN